jgi:hypothetical protein
MLKYNTITSLIILLKYYYFLFYFLYFILFYLFSLISPLFPLQPQLFSSHLTQIHLTLCLTLLISLSEVEKELWEGAEIDCRCLAVRNHHQNLHPSAPPTLATKPTFVSPPLASSPRSYTLAKPPMSPSPAVKPSFLSLPLAPFPGSYTLAKPPASPSPAAVTSSVSTPPAPSPEAYTPAKPPASASASSAEKKEEI